MKKIIVFITLVTFFSTTISAQFGFQKRIKGNGNLITTHLQVPDYDEINVTGSFDVSLYQAKEGNIEISVEENLKDYLDIESKNNKLSISWSNDVNIINTTKKVKIKVPVESIHKIMITGSGEIQNNFTLKEKNMEIVVTGSGNVLLNLDTNITVAQLTGSGDIKLTGKTIDLQNTVSGSGNFYGYELIAENVKVTVSGSGNSDVYASQDLKAVVSGSGTINYKGHPKTDKTTVTGSGNINLR